LIARLAADDRLASIPAIVMSATDTPHLGPQVVAFLEKPFAMDKLLRAIRSAAQR
jgi:CheY-like chemotaxis protein